jgi:hypothetical protein
MTTERKSQTYWEIYSDWYIKNWLGFMPLFFVATFIFSFTGDMEIFLLLLSVATAILIVDVAELIKSMKKAKAVK